MSKSLEERLADAGVEFAKADAALLRNLGKVPLEVGDHFRTLIALGRDLDQLIDLIQVRAAARSLLDGLENDVDSDDLVRLGARRAKFRHVRMIGVQSYLATQWALADRLTGIVGKFLCTPAAAFNDSQPAQLVAQFVQEDGRRKHTVGTVWESIRRTFGWPIGISYALRNHIFHDGGYAASAEFFDGPTATARFAISAVGWTRLEQRTKTYGVDPAYHRVGQGWPATPRDDLRTLLDVCERETDDALGVLVGSACRTLVAHVGCIIGED
jgi:hypothetical protein